jgi:enoyl-CoA hydratase/carnithine racemase
VYDYRTADVSIDDGVCTVRLHSRGGSLVWGALPHRELAALFAEIGGDASIRAVVITGTGEAFIGLPPGDNGGLARGELPAQLWSDIAVEGERLLNGLLAIPVPMIAAVNGPAVAHAEIAVLCDLVIATPETYFADRAHVPLGLVPGDGVHVVWPMLLGPNRGRWFLLTGQQIDAAEALSLGIVGEIVPAEGLQDRAAALGRDIADRDPAVMRATRSVLTRALRRAMTDDLAAGLAAEAFGAMAGRDRR